MHGTKLAPALTAAILLCASPSAGSPKMDEGTAGHGHAHDTMREAEGAPPTVALEVIPDSVAGYNLHLVTDNFRFSPDKAGIATEGIEGHAHLYVNGEKKARVYGPWFHLPDGWLAAGENTVRVTLNDNVHRVWAAGGKPVAAEVILTEAGAFAGTVIERSLGEGKAETIVVPRGAAVRLVLHAPAGTELHLHGYDLTGTAGPDAPVIMTFDAHHLGRFPIEAHGIDDVLGRAEKALAYVEVRPE